MPQIHYFKQKPTIHPPHQPLSQTPKSIPKPQNFGAKRIKASWLKQRHPQKNSQQAYQVTKAEKHILLNLKKKIHATR